MLHFSILMTSAFFHHCLTTKIRNRKAEDAAPRAVNDFLALIDGLLLLRLKGKADALTFEILRKGSKITGQLFSHNKLILDDRT